MSHPRDIADYERAYGESGFEVVQAAYRKRMLVELLERLRPARILEVGCGLDTLAAHWLGAERFTIVEPGAQFAAAARGQTAGRADVTILEATLEAALPHLSGGFDLILLSGLLHEVSDCGPILDAARTLCGAETVVHANVPNARSFHRLLALEMGLIEDVTEHSDLQKRLQQHRTFTQESLAALVAEHGFAPFETGSYFVKPFTHGQMQRLGAEGFLTPEMLDGLWGLTKHMPGLGSEIFVNMRRAG
jgi:SAM-dependent methyltransferase